MTDTNRIDIGIWSELGAGARWANEGVSRVIGFVIEGGAKSKKYRFHVVVQPGLGEDVRKDLRTLHAQEDVDWLVHETDPVACKKILESPSLAKIAPDERQMAAAAMYCNANIDVAGWFISFPFFCGAIYLDGPKATLMPDALGYDFPLGFSAHDWSARGSQVTWRKKSTRVLAASDTTITFSRHVARRHVVPLLNAPESRIQVVPLAPPDLAPLLPFVQDRRRTEASYKSAADLLRRHAALTGHSYLCDFPFEEVPFVVTATQDRVTKNLGRVAEAVRRIVQRQRQNMKLLVTARIEFGADWTLMPKVVEEHLFNRDLISVRDVPRKVHAALFHCATVTVHPTLFEGIIGSLPFYESLSVGTPCILARGPHVNELLESEPDLKPYVFDPYDIDGMANLIVHVRDNREAVLAAQRVIYARLVEYGWDQVAEAYAQAAITPRERTEG
ncbi:MAG: hypothetical protein J0I80_13840 [Sphingomonas sp.]|nr:hypothetical protein [Sphingomonas sp.]